MKEMTYQIMNIEEITNLLSQNTDVPSNQFKFYPKQVYITDSYNNPLYPFHEIVLDKYTFDLPKYKRYLEKEIFGQTLEYLPFHFWIEFINDDYYIFLTRPLYLKPVINEEKYSDIRNSYLIMICGDTYRDIYPREFQYKLFRLLSSLYNILSKVHNSLTQTKFLKPLHIDINRILSHELQSKLTSAK